MYTEEQFYVVFDGTSAYVAGEEEILEIESNPFATEEIYGPFPTFREAADREDEINREAGIY